MKSLDQTSEHGVLPMPTPRKSVPLYLLRIVAEQLAGKFVTYALPNDLPQEAHSHLEGAMTLIATMWAGLGS